MFKEKSPLDKKFTVLEKNDRTKFYNDIFLVWVYKKKRLFNKLVCFWCTEILDPEDYFKKKKSLFFISSRGGEIFEQPNFGHAKFNKLYQDTVHVELCDYCYYNLDMYNKTGLWFYNKK